MKTTAQPITYAQTTKVKKAKALRERPGLAELPTFESVQFTNGRIEFKLNDGREVSIPLEWSEALQRATPVQRQNFTISPWNIFWDEIDEIIGVENILYGDRLYLR